MNTTVFVVCLNAFIASGLASQQGGSPVRTGPYFGQTPPGSEPEVFAPGLVSLTDTREYGITFSPDGREVYFTRATTTTGGIMVSRWDEDGWTAPTPAAFSAGHAAHEPHVTFDNRRIYWGWRGKPTPDGTSYGIYVSERTPEGWSAAEYAGQGMYVTSSRSGRMYVTAPPRWERGPLAEVTLEGSRFAGLTPIPNLIGAHPGVAPDGSYILFDNGNGMMRVSFLQASGEWGEPVDLTRHGIFPGGFCPSVSPDGEYLFFSHAGDIYWVSTTLIEDVGSGR